MVAKGVKSVTKTTKSGKFCKRLSNEEGENMKKPISETSRSLEIRVGIIPRKSTESLLYHRCF